MSAQMLKLGRDENGAVAIELGLLVPILGALLIGLVDFGQGFSDRLRLEQVAQRTVEKVQQSGFKASMETTLETEAAAAAGTGATADITYWIECNGTKMTTTNAYTTGCTSGQLYARYVQVDVQKTYTPIIPATFGGGQSSNGSFVLHGIAGIRIQ